MGMRSPHSCERSMAAADVCGIVSLFVLELVHALLEVGVGIHLVIGDAGAEGIDQRETLVLNAGGDQVSHVIWFAGKARERQRWRRRRWPMPSGLMGNSTFPFGVDLVRWSFMVVGEAWPVVRP